MSEKIKNRLKRFFINRASTLNIELVYLFGSRAVDKEGPLSDHDIAILFGKDPARGETYRLAHELTVLLGTDRIDLIELKSAPIELQYAVIASGMVVFEINKAKRVEFEAITLSRYGDFLPILRRQRDEILEKKYNENRIQRYRAALGKTQQLLEQIGAVQGQNKSGIDG